MNIDGYDVLRENNYSMKEGGISVLTAGVPAVGRGKRQAAGIDYAHTDHCQVRGAGRGWV